LTGDRLADEYETPESVVRVEHDRVPVEGGMLVLVHGLHLSERGSLLGLTRCRFGDAIVVATLMAQDVAGCYAPPFTQGASTVELSANGIDFTDSGVGIQFTRMALDHLSPPTGPLTGGTQLQIFGTKLGTGAFHCLFDGQLREAVMESTDMLSCSTPEISESVTTPTSVVRIMYEGVQLLDKLYFVNVAPVLITKIEPLTGPRHGATAVTVFGQNFLMTSHSFCKFSRGDVLLVVESKWVSSRSIECTTPIVPADGWYDIEVTQNSQQYTDSRMTFWFRDAVVPVDFYPSSGPPGGARARHIPAHLPANPVPSRPSPATHPEGRLHRRHARERHARGPARLRAHGEPFVHLQLHLGPCLHRGQHHPVRRATAYRGVGRAPCCEQHAGAFSGADGL
jgi:hypothetical protein